MQTTEPKNKLFRYNLLSYSAFPVLLIAHFVVAYFAIKQHWNLELILFLLWISNLIILSILEKVIPRNKISIYFKRDLFYIFSSNIFNKMSTVLAGAITIFLSERFFPNTFEISFVWEVILAILVTELVIYLLHRFMHRKNNWFWKIHSIHHLPEQIYTLMQSVIHPFNMIFVFLILNIILLGIGFSSNAIFIAILLITFMSAIGHTNAHIKLGFLNYFFQGPDLHHFHHSQKWDEGNKNLGSALTLFDILFGTFHYKKNKYPEKIGIKNSDEEYAQQNKILDQLSIPVK
jgi:sterol desaturase/sphingolipid hydroxylase (fatty acid hydroxylase superfamily)